MITPLINIDSCKGCGLCISFCTKDALGFSHEINARGVRYAESNNPENCTGCGICYNMCPDAVIEIVEKEAVKAGV